MDLESKCHLFTRRDLLFIASSVSFATLFTKGQEYLVCEPHKASFLLKKKKPLLSSYTKDTLEKKDFVAQFLNQLFNKKGWLIKKESKVLLNGDIHLTKVYKSQYHRRLYSKMWNVLSENKPIELSQYDLVQVNKHIC